MATEALPKTYKAAIYDEPGKISAKVVEKDMPEPAAGDVLIRLCVLVHHRGAVNLHGMRKERLTSLEALTRGSATVTLGS